MLLDFVRRRRRLSHTYIDLIESRPRLVLLFWRVAVCAADGGFAIGSRMRLSEGSDEDTIFTFDGIEPTLLSVRDMILSFLYVHVS